MSLSIVIGGQFGDEGKGKVANYFANKLNAVAAVRVGGSNSEHTVVDENGEEYIFHNLPTASINPSIISILPSGTYIDVNILKSEMESVRINSDNLKIDPFAVIIDKSMIDEERNAKLYEHIGSTGSGTGAAVVRRLSRQGKFVFAKDCNELKPYITDTKSLMRKLLDDGKEIIVEGTQGFGLSPINSTFHPHCTSRDTTAAGALMETGLSPFDVKNVIMVIRTFPIRVSGNSGPLPNEINWDTVTKLSGANCSLIESLPASKRIHRVAKFDAEVVKKAIQVNNPNIIVLNHLDYVDYSCHNFDAISDKAVTFINIVSSEIQRKIDYIGTGKSTIIENCEE